MLAEYVCDQILVSRYTGIYEFESAIWMYATYKVYGTYMLIMQYSALLLSGVPDYFGPNKISSGGDLSHYSSASLY